MADDILTEAHGLVRGDRLRHYGPPVENFQRIADLWTAYLGPSLRDPITSQDVCSLMVLLKQARIRTGGGYHRDSAVDTAGYAALQEILAEDVEGFAPADIAASLEGDAEIVVDSHPCVCDDTSELTPGVAAWIADGIDHAEYRAQARAADPPMTHEDAIEREATRRAYDEKVLEQVTDDGPPRPRIMTIADFDEYENRRRDRAALADVARQTATGNIDAFNQHEEAIAELGAEVFPVETG
jgi:hypothetical protein